MWCVARVTCLVIRMPSVVYARRMRLTCPSSTPLSLLSPPPRALPISTARRRLQSSHTRWRHCSRCRRLSRPVAAYRTRRYVVAYFVLDSMQFYYVRFLTSVNSNIFHCITCVCTCLYACVRAYYIFQGGFLKIYFFWKCSLTRYHGSKTSTSLFWRTFRTSIANFCARSRFVVQSEIIACVFLVKHLVDYQMMIFDHYDLLTIFTIASQEAPFGIATVFNLLKLTSFSWNAKRRLCV